MKQDILNKIKNFLTNIIPDIQNIETKEEGITLSKNNDSGTETFWIHIEVSDPKILAKNESEVIHAINHLAKKILEKELSLIEEEKRNMSAFDIIVDINGFQKKRIESIKALAHMMAERARYFKSNIEIDPMSAFERRIVHEFLSNATDIKTESQGLGKNRRVVIKYTGN